LQTTAFIELFQEAVGHSRLKLQMTLLLLQFCDVQCDAVVMHQAIKEVNYRIFIPVPTSTKIILKNHSRNAGKQNGTFLWLTVYLLLCSNVCAGDVVLWNLCSDWAINVM